MRRTVIALSCLLAGCASDLLCVRNDAKVGQLITHPNGSPVAIAEVFGPSYRCQGTMPNLVRVGDAPAKK